MATIRASCNACGDVELTTRDVRVVMCSKTNEGSYAFQCPACRLAVSKPAESRVIDVLVAAGVAVTIWHMPAELEEVHTGPAISYDDLLEFHFALQRTDALAPFAQFADAGHPLHATSSRDALG